MRKNAVLTVLFAGLLAFAAQAHWRLQQDEERIEWLLNGIEEMAREDAERDIAESRASYRLRGKLSKDFCGEFNEHFKNHSITATCSGCISTHVQEVYSVEYNRVLEEHDIEKHGRNLFKEFRDRYYTRFE